MVDSSGCWSYLHKAKDGQSQGSTDPHHKGHFDRSHSREAGAVPKTLSCFRCNILQKSTRGCLPGLDQRSNQLANCSYSSRSSQSRNDNQAATNLQQHPYVSTCHYFHSNPPTSTFHQRARAACTVLPSSILSSYCEESYANGWPQSPSKSSELGNTQAQYRSTNTSIAQVTNLKLKYLQFPLQIRSVEEFGCENQISVTEQTQ